MPDQPTSSSRTSSRRRGPRFYLAMAAAKLTRAACELTRHGGGQLPGVVATSICPDVLAGLEKPEHLVFVTGTNGKTTTTNLIADLLKDAGEDPLINRAGGNVTDGITSTLIAGSALTGRPRHRFAVLELDERCAYQVFERIVPDLLVVTNLYRDTFTRNAHVEFVFDILSPSVPASTHLVLNADDLISGRLAPQCAGRTYYAMCDLPSDTADQQGIVSDLTACPVCGGHLTYERCHLGHIGRARCDACGLTNPPADFQAVAVDEAAREIAVRDQRGGGTADDAVDDGPASPADAVARYRYKAGSVTDLYNLLAATTAARLLGLPADRVERSLAGGVGVVASRYSEVDVAGKRLVCIASKGENGMACSRGFANIRREPGTKAVVLMLEDYYLARDPQSTEFGGWFYETDFEYLADPSIKQVVITGVRSEDIVLRLLLAGIDPSIMVEAPDGMAAADVVAWRDVDAVFYSHAIHNEQVAHESRDHLAALIKGEAGA